MGLFMLLLFTHFAPLALALDYISCNTAHVETALSHGNSCKLRLLTQELAPPNLYNKVNMVPQTAQVAKCIGTCRAHSCVPTRQVVMQIPVPLSNCWVDPGPCTKQCSHLTIYQELDCAWNCPNHLQQSCTSQFNEATCSCGPYPSPTIPPPLSTAQGSQFWGGSYKKTQVAIWKLFNITLKN